ncbi:MAG: YbaN family protein [Rikenellaceae bacterium]|nr:YbaN family protein [Rikenellaceae bacterium]
MKIVFIIIGSIAFALGIIGIFLPLLPTTPLLLLAAALYFRSSPRLYEWLLNHPYFGRYIRNFRESRAIPLHAKIVSVSLLWLTMGYCIVAVVEPLWLRIVLGVLAVAITIHILSFKTLRKS